MTQTAMPYGIVTYHDGFNFGAYLQVYALQKVMTLNGFPAEVVNYKSRRHWLHEYRCLLWTKRPTVLAKNVRKLLAFRALHRRLPMSAFSTRAAKFAHHRYAAVVYGSDEIWNFSNPLVGLDPFYFGAGLQGVRKIAYAPSCGNLRRDADIPGQVAKLWQGFDDIAVRDINSQAIVARHVSAQPEIVLDPTFLYDFSAETRPCVERNFILVYTTGLAKREEDAIRAYATQHGKQLISIGYRNAFCDRSVIGIGPFEFLGYYQAADFVVTSMFHGTIFAMKCKKRFAVMVDPYRTNKLEYILTRFGLTGRVTDGPGLAGVLDQNLDYDVIDSKIAQDVERSKSYLFRSLAKE